MSDGKVFFIEGTKMVMRHHIGTSNTAQREQSDSCLYERQTHEYSVLFHEQKKDISDLKTDQIILNLN